jgi:hypothetical protein
VSPDELQRALPHPRHADQNLSALRAVPGRFLCPRPVALITLGRDLKRLQAAVAMPIEDIFDSSPRIQTTNVDEATDVLSRVYLPMKLRPAGSNPLDMELKAEELPMLTARYLHLGTDVCIRADDVPAYYIEAPLSDTAVNVWRDGLPSVPGYLSTKESSLSRRNLLEFNVALAASRSAGVGAGPGLNLSACQVKKAGAFPTGGTMPLRGGLATIQ